MRAEDKKKEKYNKYFKIPVGSFKPMGMEIGGRMTANMKNEILDICKVIRRVDPSKKIVPLSRMNQFFIEKISVALQKGLTKMVNSGNTAQMQYRADMERLLSKERLRKHGAAVVHKARNAVTHMSNSQVTTFLSETSSSQGPTEG